MALQDITIKLLPETPLLPSYLPSIDMIDPADRSKRFQAYPRFEEEGDSVAAYFDLPHHIAVVVLARDPHLYKLWAPATLRVPIQGEHGAMKIATLTSADPSAGRKDALVNAPVPQVRGRGKASAPPPPPVEALPPVVQPVPQIDAGAIGDDIEALLNQTEEE